jgi:hypothetical protein
MKSTIQKLSAEEKAIRDKFKALIQSLPESADGVKMLGTNCCSVSMNLIKEHGFNWSPRYWLCAETKTALIAMIDKSQSMASLSKSFEKVIATGKVDLGSYATQSVIPPNVLNALKQIWEK